MQLFHLFKPFWQPLGVDLFCLGKKFLVFNLVSRNLKIKYRRSIFGVLWTVLIPIAMALNYYLVFNLILKVTMPHYLAFIVSGVVTFNFFSQSIMEGMESIVGNWSLASKVPMPLQIFSYVGTLTNLITFAISLPVLIGASLISHVQLSLSVIVLPFYFLILFGMTYGLSFLLSVGFVFFRDLRHLMGIVMQLWFYGTPVIYRDTMIPDSFRWILYLNPVSGIVMSIHKILVDGAWPSWKMTSLSLIWMTLILFLAAIVHKKWIMSVVEQI